jgi:hypothetical protein
LERPFEHGGCGRPSRPINVAEAGLCVTAPSAPLHLFPIACKHCGITLATLDLRTNDVQPIANVVLIVDMRHWHLSLHCPDCRKVRLFAISAMGLVPDEGLWFGRRSESAA